MSHDIFSFWSRISDSNNIHPDDVKIFDRLKHNFEPDCLPMAYFGPLKHAPVVLLFLSPGYTEFDSRRSTDAEVQSYYKSQRKGTAPLPTKEQNGAHHKWWTRIVRQFGIEEPDSVADKIAILNIGAYHSESFNDWHMLTALPSSRVSLDWAQSVLFPQAEEGNRVVVCLRSPHLWGLDKGEKGKCNGGKLYAPLCTRGGYMYKEPPLRKKIITEVQTAIAEHHPAKRYA